MKLSLRQMLKECVPPALLNAWRAWRAAGRPADWEYCPQGWRTRDPRIQGWDAEGVVRSQQQTWPDFVRLVRSTGPLGINHTDLVPAADNPVAHNIVMCYAYVLARAAHGKQRLRVLDWGGGLGHYYEISRALLPQVELDYTCKELPLLCAAGRATLPEVRFIEEDGEALSRRYDLVISSSSLHYVEDWRGLLRSLAAVTDEYLYITRLPLIRHAPSYVMVQRPYACGYDTEYLGWVLNRSELLEAARGSGLLLEREFLIEERPEIRGAPEQPQYGGFLFRRADDA